MKRKKQNSLHTPSEYTHGTITTHKFKMVALYYSKVNVDPLHTEQ